MCLIGMELSDTIYRHIKSFFCMLPSQWRGRNLKSFGGWIIFSSYGQGLFTMGGMQCLLLNTRCRCETVKCKRETRSRRGWLFENAIPLSNNPLTDRITSIAWGKVAVKETTCKEQQLCNNTELQDNKNGNPYTDIVRRQRHMKIYLSSRFDSLPNAEVTSYPHQCQTNIQIPV